MKHTENDNLPGGIITIDKPCGFTSFDVVNKLRRLYNTSRIGHTGTLDPLATGVLVVLIGRAAKACEYVSSDSKRYTATLKLGLVTDSEDITGNILSVYDKAFPSYEQVVDACKSFVGRITQIPPMYSAIKVNGKKLCDLARQGKVIEREGREIEIFSIDCRVANNPNEYILDVKCSGGTYIRTLCSDIGAALGCGGVMSALRRTEANGISIESAYTISQIESMTEEERILKMLPTQTLFSDYQAVRLPKFFERLCRDGCPIYQKKIKTSINLGQTVRLCDESGNFFALGKSMEYEGEPVIKAQKIFVI